MIGEHPIRVILQPTEYSIATLFASDHAVAICQAQGEPLKNLILLVHDAGWGVVVIETAEDENYLVATAARIHQGSLLSDTRKWSRDQGYHFCLKGSDEQVLGPRENIFALPDGRVIEVRRVLARANNLTHWGLRGEKVPDGYARL